MKVCPVCHKTYSDDLLNYCLEDGAILNPGGDQQAETILINQARPTHPIHTAPQQSAQQAGWNLQPHAHLPKKSSKAWIVVGLILGVVVLVCGGGFAGLIFLASQQPGVSSNQSNAPTNSSGANTANTSSNSTTTSTSNRTDVEQVDISKWVRSTSAFGETEFKDGEFFMSAKQKGYYYVLVAPEVHTTEDADTRVTLRNVDDASSTLGYGLIFHSNPKPLQQDYAFLIDTKRKRYRVVHHTPQKENAVVNWKSSTAINAGSAENVLEARDQSDKIELYINGQMVTSIRNVYGYTGGVAGLYSGDGVKIAFKDLEILR